MAAGRLARRNPMRIRDPCPGADAPVHVSLARQHLEGLKDSLSGDAETLGQVTRGWKPRPGWKPALEHGPPEFLENLLVQRGIAPTIQRQLDLSHERCLPRSVTSAWLSHRETRL